MSTTRAEAYRAELKRLADEEEVLYERRKAVEPEPFVVGGKTVAHVGVNGDLNLSQGHIAPDDVLGLILYLGRWFSESVETVEARAEEAE